MFIPIVAAVTEYPELKKGESFLIKDKNITLLGIGKDLDSVLLCVNNEIAILSGSKTVNGVGISLRDAEEDVVSLKVIYKCPNCVCAEDCSNRLCIRNSPTDAPEEKQEINKTIEPKIIKINNQPEAKSRALPFVLALALIVVILTAIFVKKK